MMVLMIFEFLVNRTALFFLRLVSDANCSKNEIIFRLSLPPDLQENFMFVAGVQDLTRLTTINYKPLTINYLTLLKNSN